MRLKLVRQSLHREPPVPEDIESSPADDFYDGEIPEWTPDEETSDDGEPSNQAK